VLAIFYIGLTFLSGHTDPRLHSPVSAWTSETIGVLSVLPCFNTTRLFASRFFGLPPIVRDTDGQVVRSSSSSTAQTISGSTMRAKRL
jgi:hypothetical protein